MRDYEDLYESFVFNFMGWIMSVLAVSHCLNIFITDFYLFLLQENKWMKQFLEDEQKSRKELERVVRKISKQKNDCTWEDGGH